MSDTCCTVSKDAKNLQSIPVSHHVFCCRNIMMIAVICGQTFGIEHCAFLKVWAMLLTLCFVHSRAVTWACTGWPHCHPLYKLWHCLLSYHLTTLKDSTSLFHLHLQYSYFITHFTAYDASLKCPVDPFVLTIAITSRIILCHMFCGTFSGAFVGWYD